MNNYIINKKTIALLKQNDKIKIYDVDNLLVFNTKISKIINNSCLLYGSNLKGRKKFAQKFLNIKYRVPIIISENKKIILLQINGLREEECLFIVGNKIVDYEEINDKVLKIKCINNIEICANISKYSFEKILINYLKLYNNLNYINNMNFLLK